MSLPPLDAEIDMSSAKVCGGVYEMCNDGMRYVQDKKLEGLESIKDLEERCLTPREHTPQHIKAPHQAKPAYAVSMNLTVEDEKLNNLAVRLAPTRSG